eukprot:jgi/Tetstr1/435529/TSEL_024433.t1
MKTPAALLLALALATVALSPAAAQETVPCKVDAFLTCGWLYIPPRYDGEAMFPVGTRLFDTGIGELDAFPADGLCSAECLDIINGPNCVAEQSMLMEACNALQCAVDVKAACGVPEAVAVNERVNVNWEEACTPTCVTAMDSSTCTGVEEIYPEFRRYKESFGPSGSECSTWQCMKLIGDNCEHYVGDYKALPARDMCDIGCYAAMTSDECRLANVEVLLQDGTLAAFSTYVDGPSFGPEAPICSQPEPENPWPSVDLIPIRPTPAPAPTHPPCEDVSPFNLCLFVGSPKEDPVPTPTPAPTEAGPEPVRFVSSFGFNEPPEGFPQSFRRRSLLQAQVTYLGPQDVTDQVSADWTQEYRETLAQYGSTATSPLTADDVAVDQINQTFVIGPDGETQTVIVDVATIMTFKDGGSARFFTSSVNDAMSEIFKDWDLQFAGASMGGQQPMRPPPDTTTDVGELSLDDPVPQQPKSAPFPIWAIVLIVVVALAMLGGLIFFFMRKKRDDEDEADRAAVGTTTPNPLNKSLVEAGEPVAEAREIVPLEPAAAAQLTTEMVPVEISQDIVERPSQ